jgi:hypothetical protein
MDTPNLYKDRRGEKTAAKEKKFALRLLSFRDSPMTLATLYRMQLRSLFLLLIIFGIGVGYFAWFNFQPGVYVMLGILAGTLLRDFGIMRTQTKLWPLQRRVLDWKKVDQMARGEDLDR